MCAYVNIHLGKKGYIAARLNVVHLLLCVMGNEAYPESQRQASLTLHTFVEKYPIVYEKVQNALGEQLFEIFRLNPDGFYSQLTPIQADVCRTNLIHMSFDNDSSN